MKEQLDWCEICTLQQLFIDRYILKSGVSQFDKQIPARSPLLSCALNNLRTISDLILDLGYIFSYNLSH